jgi:hypothetical protein
MNMLQLCQRACVETGVASNSAIQAVLPSIVGATGSLGRVVNWIGDSWLELQELSDEWDWMRSSNLLGQGVSFQTVYGQASYPLGIASTGTGTGAGTSDFGGDFGGDFAGAAGGASTVVTAGTSDFGGDFAGDFSGGSVTTVGGGTTVPGTVGIAVDSFGKWDRDSFRCYTTAFGTGNEMFLDDIPYDVWRNCYMLGAERQVRTRPVVIAVGPDQSLCLGPPPNALYTITGDYWSAPVPMLLDTDLPVGLPTRFHMLIVYNAMKKYAGYESAPEVYARGSEESGRMMRQLLVVRAPMVTFGGSLA